MAKELRTNAAPRLADPGDAGRPPTEEPRIRQVGQLRSARIEALRALCALAIVWAHSYGAATGVGAGANLYRVPDTFIDRTLGGVGFAAFIFFALSGYGLFWPFVRRDYGGGGSIKLRDYFVNRAIRIFPVYYVVLVTLLIVQEHGEPWQQWVRFGLLLQNFSDSTVGQINGVWWTLVVELHFYLVLPLLAFALAWLARGKPCRAAAILLGLGFASFALWIVKLGLDPAPRRIWRYNLPTNFWFIVPGMLLALLRLSWQERPPRWLRGRLASADLWIVAAAVLWVVVFIDWGVGALVMPTVCFLLIGAIVLPLRQSGPLIRGLGWRPLAVLGLASFSLFMLHVPVLRLIKSTIAVPFGFPGMLAVALPVCVALAFLSYRVIEVPFIHLRRPWSSASPPQVEAAPAPRPAAAEGPSGTG